MELKKPSPTPPSRALNSKTARPTMVAPARPDGPPRPRPPLPQPSSSSASNGVILPMINPPTSSSSGGGGSKRNLVWTSPRNEHSQLSSSSRPAAAPSASPPINSGSSNSIHFWNDGAQQPSAGSGSIVAANGGGDETSQLAFMDQMYSKIQSLHAELDREREENRERSMNIEYQVDTRERNTLEVMQRYGGGGGANTVEESDNFGLVGAAVPISSSYETNASTVNRKFRPHQPRATSPLQPAAVLAKEQLELCAALGKNAELRMRSKAVELQNEQASSELENTQRQVKMAERRIANREEKLRALLKEKLHWQHEMKELRDQVVEEKMRQVDLMRRLETTKRETTSQLDAMATALRDAEDENQVLRGCLVETKSQVVVQAKRMDEFVKQAREEKERLTDCITEARSKFREWKESEATALKAQKDQAMNHLKAEYELKIARHQEEKQKLRDKVKDLEVSVRLMQKDRSLSPLELSLRKATILGSKDTAGTTEAELIEAHVRIKELESLLDHSQEFQKRQETIIKVSETTISRLIQEREVAALDTLANQPVQGTQALASLSSDCWSIPTTLSSSSGMALSPRQLAAPVRTHKAMSSTKSIVHEPSAAGAAGSPSPRAVEPSRPRGTAAPEHPFRPVAPPPRVAALSPTARKPSNERPTQAGSEANTVTAAVKVSVPPSAKEESLMEQIKGLEAALQQAVAIQNQKQNDERKLSETRAAEMEKIRQEEKEEEEEQEQIASEERQHKQEEMVVPEPLERGDDVETEESQAQDAEFVDFPPMDVENEGDSSLAPDLCSSPSDRDPSTATEDAGFSVEQNDAATRTEIELETPVNVDTRGVEDSVVHDDTEIASETEPTAKPTDSSVQDTSDRSQVPVTVKDEATELDRGTFCQDDGDCQEEEKEEEEAMAMTVEPSIVDTTKVAEPRDALEEVQTDPFTADVGSVTRNDSCSLNEEKHENEKTTEETNTRQVEEKEAEREDEMSPLETNDPDAVVVLIVGDEETCVVDEKEGRDEPNAKDTTVQTSPVDDLVAHQEQDPLVEAIQSTSTPDRLRSAIQEVATILVARIERDVLEKLAATIQMTQPVELQKLLVAYEISNGFALAFVDTIVGSSVANLVAAAAATRTPPTEATRPVVVAVEDATAVVVELVCESGQSPRGMKIRDASQEPMEKLVEIDCSVAAAEETVEKPSSSVDSDADPHDVASVVRTDVDGSSPVPTCDTGSVVVDMSTTMVRVMATSLVVSSVAQAVGVLAATLALSSRCIEVEQGEPASVTPEANEQVATSEIEEEAAAVAQPPLSPCTITTNNDNDALPSDVEVQEQATVPTDEVPVPTSECCMGTVPTIVDLSLAAPSGDRVTTTEDGPSVEDEVAFDDVETVAVCDHNDDPAADERPDASVPEQEAAEETAPSLVEVINVVAPPCCPVDHGVLIRAVAEHEVDAIVRKGVATRATARSSPCEAAAVQEPATACATVEVVEETKPKDSNDLEEPKAVPVPLEVGAPEDTTPTIAAAVASLVDASAEPAPEVTMPCVAMNAAIDEVTTVQAVDGGGERPVVDDHIVNTNEEEGDEVPGGQTTVETSVDTVKRCISSDELDTVALTDGGDGGVENPQQIRGSESENLSDSFTNEYARPASGGHLKMNPHEDALKEVVDSVLASVEKAVHEFQVPSIAVCAACQPEESHVMDTPEELNKETPMASCTAASDATTLVREDPIACPSAAEASGAIEQEEASCIATVAVTAPPLPPQPQLHSESPTGTAISDDARDACLQPRVIPLERCHSDNTDWLSVACFDDPLLLGGGVGLGLLEQQHALDGGARTSSDSSTLPNPNTTRATTIGLGSMTSRYASAILREQIRDPTLLAYDVTHEQSTPFSMMDDQILQIDQNAKHMQYDENDKVRGSVSTGGGGGGNSNNSNSMDKPHSSKTYAAIEGVLVTKRKRMDHENHRKSIAYRIIPAFNYEPVLIKFQWSDFVVATPIRLMSSASQLNLLNSLNGTATTSTTTATATTTDGTTTGTSTTTASTTTASTTTASGSSSLPPAVRKGSCFFPNGEKISTSPIQKMKLLLKRGVKLPCSTYVIISVFNRPLEDGNENLRIQIYDPEHVEEFQYDFHEDHLRDYVEDEWTGGDDQARAFVERLEFRREQGSVIIKMPKRVRNTSPSPSSMVEDGGGGGGSSTVDGDGSSSSHQHHVDASPMSQLLSNLAAKETLELPPEPHYRLSPNAPISNSNTSPQRLPLHFQQQLQSSFHHLPPQIQLQQPSAQQEPPAPLQRQLSAPKRLESSTFSSPISELSRRSSRIESNTTSTADQVETK